CPTGQRRTVDVHTLRCHHLGLTVERQMMIELVHDDMGKGCKAGFTPGNSFCRRMGLHNLLAGTAAILGTDGTDNAPLNRQYIKYLAAVLPKRAKGAAAIRTITDTRLQYHPAVGPWQMIR